MDPLEKILEPVAGAVGSGISLNRLAGLLNDAKPALCRRFREGLGSETSARALTLKVLNLCLAKHHFQARSAAVLSRPLGLVIDPINVCNLACPGCVHSLKARTGKLFDWAPGIFPEDCYSALMSRYGPWVLEAMFCNYGEPLLNPETPKFIARARGCLMRTGLSTNMTARVFDARAYVESGLDFMTVSLDGATQQVYERYRRGGNLELAFANIRALVAAKKELGRENPIVSWQFLAFEHNAHEIDRAMEMARELGMDQFVVALPFDVSWDDPTIHPAFDAQPRTVHFKGNPEGRMIANFSGAADEWGERWIQEAWDAGFGEPAEEASAPASPHSCQWLYRNMVLDAKGRVLPCCAAPKPGFPLVFDNFFEHKGDSFNSAAYRAARQWFRDPAGYRTGPAGDPYCVRCEWNQDTAHTDGAQVDQYLKTVPHGIFSDGARRMLAWD